MFELKVSCSWRLHPRALRDREEAVFTQKPRCLRALRLTLEPLGPNRHTDLTGRGLDIDAHELFRARTKAQAQLPDTPVKRPNTHVGRHLRRPTLDHLDWTLRDWTLRDRPPNLQNNPRQGLDPGLGPAAALDLVRRSSASEQPLLHSLQPGDPPLVHPRTHGLQRTIRQRSTQHPQRQDLTRQHDLRQKARQVVLLGVLEIQKQAPDPRLAHLRPSQRRRVLQEALLGLELVNRLVDVAFSEPPTKLLRPLRVAIRERQVTINQRRRRARPDHDAVRVGRRAADPFVTEIDISHDH